jgi:hypothetical protein
MVMGEKAGDMGRRRMLSVSENVVCGEEMNMLPMMVLDHHFDDDEGEDEAGYVGVGEGTEMAGMQVV